MAGKKRRRRHPGGAPSGMAADHPQASRQNGRPVQIKGQQEVPVRRGGKQVRYVQQEGMQKKRKSRHFYDYSLLFIIIFLTVFGLVMIYSASSYTAQLSNKYGGNSAYFMQRQAMIAAAGFLAMLGISKLDYHLLVKLARCPECPRKRAYP